MSSALMVWVLLLASVVLFALRAFGMGLPRIDLGWLGAALAGIAALILLWPPS